MFVWIPVENKVTINKDENIDFSLRIYVLDIERLKTRYHMEFFIPR